MFHRRLFEGDDVYEYIPDFDYDKADSSHFANCKYSEMRKKCIPAFGELRSVYGDDFTLTCMLGGNKEQFHSAFINSKTGKHYIHPIHIMGIAPAKHHLLAIEEGYAIHFSDRETGGSNEIILKTLDDIEEREDIVLMSVEYNNEGVKYRLLARNRTLLVYSGRWNFRQLQLVVQQL